MWATIETEIAVSRQQILGALDRAGDITLIRGYGNLGDELIFAGTRQLLCGVRYRETSVDNLDGVRGELGLVTGGGAWCGEFDYMAKLLPEIERRFASVIVLPSSYDPNVESVRRILAGSQALFFARERVSYDLIRGICRAELAHDGAFFFDYRPYRIPQDACEGVLVSFRTDAESAGCVLPEGNEDISITRGTLDEWLWAIARCATVRTDRAHVMIAGAMLGKIVEYRATKYHKLPAIADYALKSLPVRNLDRIAPPEIIENLRAKADAQRNLLPDEYRLGNIEAKVETLKREEFASGKTLVDRVRQASAPYVLLLDTGIEMLPGAIEHLLQCAEKNGDCAAVTGTLVSSDGIVVHCGADYEIKDGVIEIRRTGRGRVLDGAMETKPRCGIIPSGWALLDRETLEHEMPDAELAPDLDLIDWCLRIGARENLGIYRCADALAVIADNPAQAGGARPKPEILEDLKRYARFFKRHGAVPAELFDKLPDFGPKFDPRARAAVRLLLAMVEECGAEWVQQRWECGDLAPLFPALPTEISALREEIVSLKNELRAERQRFTDVKNTRAWKLLTLHWRLRDALRRSGDEI